MSRCVIEVGGKVLAKIDYTLTEKKIEIVKKSSPKNKSKNAQGYPKSLNASKVKAMTTGGGTKVSKQRVLKCGGYVDIDITVSAMRYFANNQEDPKMGKFFWWDKINCDVKKVDPYIGYTINAWALLSGFFYRQKGEIYAPELYVQIKWEAIPIVGKAYKPSKVYDFHLSSATGKGTSTNEPSY